MTSMPEGIQETADSRPQRILITGGAGFFGGILTQHLLDAGYECVSIDRERDEKRHERFTAIHGDICDEQLLYDIFSNYQFDAVMHCAALLAHEVKDQHDLWRSNVDGTRAIAEYAKRFHVPRVVFISSNCLWGTGMHHPITEEEPPAPIEMYGQSKWAAEQVLQEYRHDFHVIIFRSPTIIDAGRLGLLAILFEFIHQGKKIWVVGSGENRYQFIAAQDLAAACQQALSHHASDIFHVGSDAVRPLREVYGYVIAHAQTGARIAHLPRRPAIAALRAAHALRLSPLGPYHYRMIAEPFIFDTSKIQRALHWKPTLTNEEMLLRAYHYYCQHRDDIAQKKDGAAHTRAAPMGIIRLLKFFS